MAVTVAEEEYERQHGSDKHGHAIPREQTCLSLSVLLENNEIYNG